MKGFQYSVEYHSESFLLRYHWKFENWSTKLLKISYRLHDSAPNNILKSMITYLHWAQKARSMMRSDSQVALLTCSPEIRNKQKWNASIPQKSTTVYTLLRENIWNDNRYHVVWAPFDTSTSNFVNFEQFARSSGKLVMKLFDAWGNSTF